MTTKEKIILQSIEVINSRLSEIDRIIDFNPFSEIRKVREQAQELLENNKTIEERVSPNFMAQLIALGKKEDEIIMASQKSRNILELLNEKGNITNELSDLRVELYWIEDGKKRLKK